MKYKNILCDRTQEILKIIINRPHAMNALNFGVISELITAIEQAGKDERLRVVLLTGAGRAFSAGVDLPSLVKDKSDTDDIEAKIGSMARGLINAIETIPKVVIAMINGYCLTGALEIILACDIIIASEEAKFGDTHTKWGLHPIWGMSQRLPRAIGMLKAKELSFTAQMITAREAERLGLVNLTVPADKLEETVQQLANKIIANSPDAIAAYKYLYNRGAKDTLEKGLDLEIRSKFVIRDIEARMEKFGKKK